MVLPQAQKDVFCLTSILPSIKKLYPDHNIYFITSPDCFDVLDGNPYIHKTITYSDQLDNPFTLEGRGDHEGYFDLAFLPFLETKRVLNYTHNGKDKLQFNLK